jgi:hypothetical protein
MQIPALSLLAHLVHAGLLWSQATFAFLQASQAANLEAIAVYGGELVDCGETGAEKWQSAHSE